MREILINFKPKAPRRAHLLLAAGMWTIVGFTLLTLGLRIMWISHWHWRTALVIAALIAGIAKSIIVFQRAAKRIVERIEARGDGRCLGGFFSWRTWLLVATMIIAGRLLRMSPLPREVIGLILIAIGSALILGTRQVWHAWLRARSTPM